ncbi:MAG: RagB/SusD family nutrient uptake outer membrane protein [Parabacteroides sp.]
MKKTILVISIILVALTSCESNSKFLEETPNGSLFPENFLNNATELQMMTNSMYWIWVHAMDRPYQSLECKFNSADDMLGFTTRPCFNEMEINADISTSGDNDIQLAWERCYNAINQANSIINNYHNADGSMTEAELNGYAAQAYFVRAFTYFWLVRFFNNIPLVTTAFEADKTLTLSKAADVYKLIISDLQFAEEWLPVTWSNATYKVGGAFTKGAAKSLLAKVYLQMAGFPVNGGTEYYALARDKAKEVIDNASTYGYALRNHFYEIWDPYWTAYDKTPDEAIIWVEHSLVEPQYSVRAPNPSRPVELGGWNLMIAENYFYKHFPEGERKDFTFVTDFYVQGGTHVTYDYFSSKHPYYRKWWADELSEGWKWDANGPGGLWKTHMEQEANWYDTRAIVMMRYADILLTYAEAKARTDGPDALAYQCLNDVRNRAYKGVGTTDASLSGLSTEAFIDKVVWERAYEFAGFEYSARWFDLQRLQLVEKATTEWRDEPDAVFKIVKSYTKKDYFLPIPSKEIKNNPNLANNNAEFQ